MKSDKAKCKHYVHYYNFESNMFFRWFDFDSIRFDSQLIKTENERKQMYLNGFKVKTKINKRIRGKKERNNSNNCYYPLQCPCPCPYSHRRPSTSSIHVYIYKCVVHAWVLSRNRQQKTTINSNKKEEHKQWKIITKNRPYFLRSKRRIK